MKQLRSLATVDYLKLDRFDTRDFEIKAGVFSGDPRPAMGVARLYHGTTDVAARQIAREGFKPFDAEGLVRATASRLGISYEDLVEELLGTHLADRLTYTEEGQDNGAYFADSPLSAGDWAMWGSESEVYARAAIAARDQPERFDSAFDAFNWTA